MACYIVTSSLDNGHKIKMIVLYPYLLDSHSVFTTLPLSTSLHWFVLVYNSLCLAVKFCIKLLEHVAEKTTLIMINIKIM